MDTTIAGHDERALNRSKGPADAGAAPTRESARRASLTNRDLEAEVLARLADQGYDWTGLRTAPSMEDRTELPKKKRKRKRSLQSLA